MVVGSVVTVCLSVSIEQLGYMGRIFVKFGTSGFLKLSRKFRFGKEKKTLDQDLCTFTILSRWIQKKIKQVVETTTTTFYVR